MIAVSVTRPQNRTDAASSALPEFLQFAIPVTFTSSFSRGDLPFRAIR